MAKKVSLQDRKRLKDLMGDEAHLPSEEKLIALRAAQQEVDKDDASKDDSVTEQLGETADLLASQVGLTKQEKFVSVSTEKQAIKNEVTAPELDLVAPYSAKNPAPKSSVTSADHFDLARDWAQEIYNVAMNYQLRNNTSNRLAMSRQAQHDSLIDILKKHIAKKGNELLAEGVLQERALMICQALIDDVRVLLAQQNVELNPLHLKKPRQARI